MKRIASNALATGLIVALTLLLAACGSDPDGKEGASTKKTYGLPSGVLKTLTSVNTSLSALEAQAGVAVTVACVGQPGDVLIPEPAFDVTPSEGVKIDKNQLIIERAGTYAVACTIHDGATKDDTPETLKIGPASAVKTLAKVAPSKVASGAKATVTCSAEDAFGNAIDAATAKWDITSGDEDVAAIDGTSAEGKKVGKADLHCRLTDAKDAVSTPGSLEVTVGGAAKSVATVDPTDFVAGGSATVTCKVTDAAGNVI